MSLLSDLTAAATALKNASAVQMDGETPKPVDVRRPIDPYSPDPVTVAFQSAASGFVERTRMALANGSISEEMFTIPRSDAKAFVDRATGLCTRATSRVRNATADSGLNSAIDTLVSNIAARMGWA